MPQVDAESAVTMYPNPCIDQLNIEVQQLKSVSVVYITGKVVLQSTQSQIEVRDLPQGVYSVIIITKNRQVVKRLIK